MYFLLYKPENDNDLTAEGTTDHQCFFLFFGREKS